MAKAIEYAQQAAYHDEVPVGAVLVKDNRIIAAASNAMHQKKDVTCHAEMLCIKEASRILNTAILEECDLYVTLEPCPMCAGALCHARIRTVYFGAYDPKGGGICHGACVFDHALWKPDYIGGIEERACSELLSNFFKTKR